MNTIAIICSVLAALSSLCAVFGFVINRKKDHDTDVHDMTWLKSELMYMKNGLDDIRLDVKGIARKQTELNERVVRTEERINALESRIEHIENRLKGD